MTMQTAPRMFLTAAAKGIVLRAIREGRDTAAPTTTPRRIRPMYPIERIAPPEGTAKRLARPLGHMAVGESYFEPGKGDQDRERIRWATRHHLPRRFQIEAVTENGTEGFRVWRIK